MMASEEVRKVVGQINYDLAETYSQLDALSYQNNQAINLVNVANFVQGGTLGIIKESLALKDKAPKAQQEIAITSFSTRIGLSLVTLGMPMLWSQHHQGKSNMLAHILDRSYRPSDAEQSYLWQFFSSPVPGATDRLTRREILIKHWESFGGLNPSESRIKLLSGSPESRLREGMGVLNQRINLLQDMKTHIEEFDASLYELHKAISIEGV